MRTRWLVALIFAVGLAAGVDAGMTGTAHASDPARPGKPFGNAAEIVELG
jgi:hypothetical protein